MPRVPSTLPGARLSPLPVKAKRPADVSSGLGELGRTVQGATSQLATQYAKQKQQTNRTVLLHYENLADQKMMERTEGKDGYLNHKGKAAVDMAEDYHGGLRADTDEVLAEAPENVREELRMRLDVRRKAYARDGLRHERMQHDRFEAFTRDETANRGISMMRSMAHDPMGLGAVIGTAAVKAASESLPEEEREAFVREKMQAGWSEMILKLIGDEDDVPGSVTVARGYYNRDDVQEALGERAEAIEQVLESVEKDVGAKVNAAMISEKPNVKDDQGRIRWGEAEQHIDKLPEDEQAAARAKLEDADTAARKMAKQQIWDLETKWRQEFNDRGFATSKLKILEGLLNQTDDGSRLLAQLHRERGRKRIKARGAVSNRPKDKVAVAKVKDEEESLYAVLWRDLRSGRLDDAAENDFVTRLREAESDSESTRYRRAIDLFFQRKEGAAWKGGPAGEKEVEYTLDATGQLDGLDETKREIVLQRHMDDIEQENIRRASQDLQPLTEDEVKQRVARNADEGRIGPMTHFEMAEEAAKKTAGMLLQPTGPLESILTMKDAVWQYATGATPEVPTTHTRLEAREAGETFYPKQWNDPNVQKYLADQIARYNKLPQVVADPSLQKPNTPEERLKILELKIAKGEL